MLLMEENFDSVLELVLSDEEDNAFAITKRIMLPSVKQLLNLKSFH